MPPKGIKYIPVKEYVYTRIKGVAHKGQSLGGTVEDLLDEHLQGALVVKPETIKRLEDYRSHPKESVDDLIRAVLDELENKINSLGGK